MTVDSMNKVILLNKSELQKLTEEVQETLADKSLYSTKSICKFTVFDMWKVRRESRSASARIRKWNR